MSDYHSQQHNRTNKKTHLILRLSEQLFNDGLQRLACVRMRMRKLAPLPGHLLTSLPTWMAHGSVTPRYWLTAARRLVGYHGGLPAGRTESVCRREASNPRPPRGYRSRPSDID